MKGDLSAICLTSMVLFFKYFIYLKVGVAERKDEMYTEEGGELPSLFHSSDGCDACGWAMLKP